MKLAICNEYAKYLHYALTTLLRSPLCWGHFNIKGSRFDIKGARPSRKTNVICKSWWTLSSCWNFRLEFQVHQKPKLSKLSNIYILHYIVSSIHVNINVLFDIVFKSLRYQQFDFDIEEKKGRYRNRDMRIFAIVDIDGLTPTSKIKKDANIKDKNFDIGYNIEAWSKTRVLAIRYRRFTLDNNIKGIIDEIQGNFYIYQPRFYL